jgi:hypothetical protein
MCRRLGSNEAILRCHENAKDVVQMTQIGGSLAPPQQHTSYMRVVQSRAEINYRRSRHIASQAATITICIPTVASKNGGSKG